MDNEVKFFTEGLGMRVMGQSEVNGVRDVFLSYGEESLKVKDGGECKLSNSPHAVIELRCTSSSLKSIELFVLGTSEALRTSSNTFNVKRRFLRTP